MGRERAKCCWPTHAGMGGCSVCEGVWTEVCFCMEWRPVDYSLLRVCFKICFLLPSPFSLPFFLSHSRTFLWDTAPALVEVLSCSSLQQHLLVAPCCCLSTQKADSRTAGLGPCTADSRGCSGLQVSSASSGALLQRDCESCHWRNNSSIKSLAEVCLMVMTSDMLSLLISRAELRSGAGTRQLTNEKSEKKRQWKPKRNS